MLRKSLLETFPSMGKLGTTKLYLSDFVHSGGQMKGVAGVAGLSRFPTPFIYIIFFIFRMKELEKPENPQQPETSPYPSSEILIVSPVKQKWHGIL